MFWKRSAWYISKQLSMSFRTKQISFHANVAFLCHLKMFPGGTEMQNYREMG